jgi:hypothetical protein
MFIKSRYYRHRQTGDRFRCEGTTLTTVLLSFLAEDGSHQLHPIALLNAAQVLVLEDVKDHAY